MSQTDQTGLTGYEKQPPWTIVDAMLACGLTEEKAQTISEQIFVGTYEACKDKTTTEIRDGFKSMSEIPRTQGGMKFQPSEKHYVEAFNHWVKHQYRMGREPSVHKFPRERLMEINKKAKTHELYIEQYEAVSSAAKPKDLTKDTKWEDWYPSFINYLRSIPGRYGVPLAYVIRDNEEPEIGEKHDDYLDDYIQSAPLSGEAFIYDSTQVHTYIVNLVSQNEEAEAALRINEGKRKNGRADWIALKQHYEGQGMFTIKAMEAQKQLTNLFYAGEKPPQMTWTKFERTLNATFNALVQDDGAIFTDKGKLRILLDKVRCEWLSGLKHLLSLKAQERTPACTYEQALLAFRTEVHRRFPPGAAPGKIRRTIAELQGDSRPSRGFPGRFQGRGRGRGRGRGGRGRGRGRGRPHVDRREIKKWTIANGREIDYHPTFTFPPDIWNNLTRDQLDQIRKDRNEYRSRQNNDNNKNTEAAISAIATGTKRSFEEVMSQMDELRTIVSRSSVPNTVQEARSTDRSAVSQITTHTVMGGRREQALNRQDRSRSPGR